jgi:NAD+ diphosphatase
MSETSYWLLRHQNQLLISVDSNGLARFPQAHASEFGDQLDPILVGEWQGVPCFASDCSELPPHLEGELTPVRSLFSIAGPEIFALAGRATQLMDWKKNHRFCGHCATPTVMKTSEFGMECPACRLVVYPRISPAVMVLVRRGPDELLLARSPHFKPGVFSALAGFVEAGETLEECARREVMEEVGVKISRLEYFQSQSWPFPNSLMVAFFADYESGEITPDPSEIEAAAWFNRNDLPRLPDSVSIARRLIEAALNS